VRMLDTERVGNDFFVESDDELVSDLDDWYAHLVGLIDHFLALLEIRRDVVFGIRDIVGLEEILGQAAEVAGRGAVNGDVWHRGTN
jgi:hypothetical protein